MTQEDVRGLSQRFTERAKRQPFRTGTQRARMQYRSGHGYHGSRRSALVAGIGDQQKNTSVRQRQKIIIIATGPVAYRIMHRDVPACRLRDLARQKVPLKLAEAPELSL
jgi:hypothetical protein